MDALLRATNCICADSMVCCQHTPYSSYCNGRWLLTDVVLDTP